MLKILAAIAAVCVVFAAAVSMQPDEFRVSRTATISAPANIVFDLVNNQHAWASWSPWAKLDPNATFTYEGPDAGVGSTAKWSGNNQVGAGSSTITESTPAALVKFKLDFEKPMKGTDTAEFNFKPAGDKTEVTWSMYGENSFMGKAMNLIFHCEKMVGEQFDQGLANLDKAAQEKAKEVQAQTPAPAATAPAAAAPSAAAPGTAAPAATPAPASPVAPAPAQAPAAPIQPAPAQ